jgi:hypothetical protein
MECETQVSPERRTYLRDVVTMDDTLITKVNKVGMSAARGVHSP